MIGGSPALGQYFPVDSALHRLDPRAKLSLVLGFMIALFFIDQMAVMLGSAIIIPLLLVVSKLPPRWLARSLKPLIFILLFTFVIHLFLTPGPALFRLGPLTGTRTGLARGAFFGLRLILVIAVSSFVTLTTTPVRLTDAMESLLKPLKRVRLPVHEFALMATIALRFIPTLLAEAEGIIRAQKARGADFESGNIIRRARSFVPILVPLFVGAFRRADDLAVAMEARGYAGGEGRTRLHILSMRPTDYLWLFGGTVLVGALLWADRLVTGLW